MTKQEIIQEYRAAKNKVKQIGILADLNQVDKQTIVTFLIDAGESVPGNFLPRRKKETRPRTVELEPKKIAFELTTSDVKPARALNLTVRTLCDFFQDIAPDTEIYGIENMEIRRTWEDGDVTVKIFVQAKEAQA